MCTDSVLLAFSSDNLPLSAYCYASLLLGSKSDTLVLAIPYVYIYLCMCVCVRARVYVCMYLYI